MGRAVLSGLAIWLVAGFVWAQTEDRQIGGEPADSRSVLGDSHPLLSRGAALISAGDYDEGIRLTMLGLEREQVNTQNRAAALSNLCAAYAAKELTDTAIKHCTESLAINNKNWRAYSNRAYAYWLKGMYSEATFDIDAATALSPRARQVLQIRGMINESGLRPRVSVEDHR